MSNSKNVKANKNVSANKVKRGTQTVKAKSVILQQLSFGEKLKRMEDDLVREKVSLPKPVFTISQPKFTCCVCGGTKTAHRMNGKARLHAVNDTETLCHYCWLKERE